MAGRQGQLIGPHGAGKSSLLAVWASLLTHQGTAVHIRQINASSAAPHPQRMWDWSGFSPTDVLCLDGFEQLSWLRRRSLRRLVRKYRVGLLVTCHRDLGLPWTLQLQPSLARTEQLAAWLQRDCVPRVTPDDVSHAYAQCHGNVRETLLALFDIYHARSIERNN